MAGACGLAAASVANVHERDGERRRSADHETNETRNKKDLDVDAVDPMEKLGGPENGSGPYMYCR